MKKITLPHPCTTCDARKKAWNATLSRKTAERLCKSYQKGVGARYAGLAAIPERGEISTLLNDLYDLMFPGYTGRYHVTPDSQFFATGYLLDHVQDRLTEQIQRAFSYNCQEDSCRSSCRSRAAAVTIALLEKLPELREMLLEDVQAALDGDPATQSTDEIILAYPGFWCISVHRIAHELYKAGVPLIPRVMGECAHTLTGIDIHPGASIGRHFFIDHGTGVVIGETAVIGDYVKLYQGVTLGALSFPKDSKGTIIKGAKRHPNIEDRVTIYAESTILGNITIGHDSVIGGNTWLTDSVPPFSKVTTTPTELTIASKKKR